MGSGNTSRTRIRPNHVSNDTDIRIELFSSPDCGGCARTAEILEQLLREMDDTGLGWRLVNVVEELDYAVELGVLGTPAIAIDGRLAFSGRPNRSQLRKLILDARASRDA